MLLQPAMVSGVGLRKDVNANAVGVIYGYLETIVKISIVENRPEKKKNILRNYLPSPLARLAETLDICRECGQRSLAGLLGFGSRPLILCA